MLPIELRRAKNALISTAPWLVLVTVHLPDGRHIRLARNTDDVTFGGQVYEAWSLEIGEVRGGGDGRFQAIGLRVANPERALQPELEAADGLVNCAVTIDVVHADNLASDHSELRLSLTILSTSPDENWIDIQLGAPNLYRRRYPLYAALPNSCVWMFKGVECAYAGTATSCQRTLADCRALGNSPRFGGRPGLIGAPRFSS